MAYLSIKMASGSCIELECWEAACTQIAQNQVVSRERRVILNTSTKDFTELLVQPAIQIWKKSIIAGKPCVIPWAFGLGRLTWHRRLTGFKGMPLHGHHGIHTTMSYVDGESGLLYSKQSTFCSSKSPRHSMCDRSSTMKREPPASVP